MNIFVLIFPIQRGELLNQVHNFIHLNLAISLVIGLVVFIGGIEHAAEYKVSCLKTTTSEIDIFL